VIFHFIVCPTDELFEVDIYPKSSNTHGDLEDEDLEKRYKRCNKSHDHGKFFVLKNLQITDVPVSARFPGVLDYIRYESYKTVRLVTEYTAVDRPAWHGFTTLRGTTYSRTGTGSVVVPQSRQIVPGYTPGTTFFIQTAAHVVFNDQEAKATKVWFFFTDDQDMSGVIYAKGLRLIAGEVDGDWSIFICQVCTTSQVCVGETECRTSVCLPTKL